MVGLAVETPSVLLHFSSSTSSRPKLNPSGMCGIAGRVMRVGRVPLKRAERAAGLPNLSPALPAILVLYPGLGHRRLLPYTEVSRGAMEASQVSTKASR